MISDEQLEQLAEYLLKTLESKAYAEPERHCLILRLWIRTVSFTILRSWRIHPV